MNYVCIGKLVNTHGIKGEVRIISDFEYKSKVFIPGFKLYIGSSKECVSIKTYRQHKSFDMCLFNEYNYINDVLKFKGSKVYINKEDLKLDSSEILDIDLIDMEVFYLDNLIGIVKDVINNNGYKLFLINDKYIPYNKEFIVNIDKEKRVIILKNLEGLI